MGFTATVRDALDSFVPWIDGRARQPDLYKCRNCGRDADREADACPNCDSGNLRPLYR